MRKNSLTYSLIESKQPSQRMLRNMFPKRSLEVNFVFKKYVQNVDIKALDLTTT